MLKYSLLVIITILSLLFCGCQSTPEPQDKPPTANLRPLPKPSPAPEPKEKPDPAPQPQPKPKVKPNTKLKPKIKTPVEKPTKVPVPQPMPGSGKKTSGNATRSKPASASNGAASRVIASKTSNTHVESKPVPEAKPFTYVAVSKLIPSSKNTDPFLSAKSFITVWNVLGPISLKAIPDVGSFKTESEQKALINRPFVPKENELKGDEKPPKGSKWQRQDFNLFSENQAGKINLKRLFHDQKDVGAYAIASLYAPEDMNHLILYVGSSCYLKIWLNGKLVHSYNKAPRNSDWDQDVISDSITMKKGYNILLVKSIRFANPWEFYIRLTNKDGIPVVVGQKRK